SHRALLPFPYRTPPPPLSPPFPYTTLFGSSRRSRSEWAARAGAGPGWAGRRGATSPVWRRRCLSRRAQAGLTAKASATSAVALRSEEHTSALQSLTHLVCPLLLVNKNHPPH